MSYSIFQSTNFTSFERSAGFSITTTKGNDPQFSVTYITLKKGRDPVDQDALVEITPGFTGIYIVIEGDITFTFYDLAKDMEKVLLTRQEYVRISAGTSYEIEGNGQLALICLPAYSEQMFAFPKK